MVLIDSILNLACVLLWLNWRSMRLTAARKSPPVSLAATLKKLEPRSGSRWGSLFVLIGLLTARSLFYWNVGSALGWTPNLELGVVSLPFRSDFLVRMFLFSFLSFAVVLTGLYAWLLLISVINQNVSNDDPLQRLVRLQLGPVERWPVAVKILLPMVFTALVWRFGSPALVELGILPSPASRSHVWQQALLLGVTSFLSWKLLVLSVCMLYMVNCYVYLGSSTFWTYINTTGSNLLGPLRRFPICIGKLDFSPLLAILLLLLLTQWAAHWLPRAFQNLPL